MKYFKYFEELNNDDNDDNGLDQQFLLNMAINSIRNNSLETWKFAVDKGLDIDRWAYRLIVYAIKDDIYNFDMIKHFGNQGEDFFKNNIINQKWNEEFNFRYKGDISYYKVKKNLNLTKVRGLRSLENLTSFSAMTFNEVELVDISDLAYNTNLEKLVLTDNDVIDISALSKLKNLKEIFLTGNSNIKDLTPLQDLPNLENLFIGRCELKDVSFLSGMTSLKHLHMSENNIEDLTPLKSLINLEKLNVAKNNIKDITPLLNLPLMRLEIEDNQVTTLKGIENMDTLAKKYLNGIRFRNNPLPPEVLQYVHKEPKYDNYDDTMGIKDYYRNN